MEELLAAIETVSYPATREQLIDALATGPEAAATRARLEALPAERYENADQLGRDLVRRRAESNPSLVTINAEACPSCGFLIVPGEAHSCVEEKARFAESANAVAERFDADDERRSHDQL